MGQHLGHNKMQNMLRNNLEKKGIIAEECKAFHLIAHGPLFPEAKDDWEKHCERRDIVSALEKQLAEDLKSSGYNVLNEVKARNPLDQQLWASVRIAFAGHFLRL